MNHAECCGRRRSLLRAAFGVFLVGGGAVSASELAPDRWIQQLSDEVLDAIRADRNLQTGDINRVIALVDRLIMPNVNFQRMTASAVGPAWRQATPQQRERLQQEFKTLLVRTYAGAVSKVSDQTIVVRPLRNAPTEGEVTVRTEIRGRGEPIQIDYRLERTPGQGAGWKIVNFNVLGVWLMETYRSQFAQEINARGIDGLIEALAARNRANAAR